MGLDQAGDGEARGRGRRKKAKEEEFKSSLVKGSDTLHDKTKIIGDSEPWVMPTSVQGINICCAENVCMRASRKDSQPGACASLHFQPVLCYRHLPQL